MQYEISKIDGNKTLTMKVSSVSESEKIYQKNSGKESPFKNEYNRRRIQEFKETHSLSWSGCRSEAQFLKILADGDKDRAKKIQSLDAQDILPKSIRRRRTRTDQGDDLDIHSVYSGELSRAWNVAKKKLKFGTSKNITLIVDVCANCKVDADSLAWRGFAALKAADVLTEVGYNVRIVVGAGSNRLTEEDGSAAIFVTAKDFDEYLDVQKLASVIALPAYFRIILFGLYCLSAELMDTEVRGGLGQPAHVLLEEQGKKEFGEEGEIIMINDELGEEKTKKWLEETLKKFTED